jgi:hypothetical protein
MVYSIFKGVFMKNIQIIFMSSVLMLILVSCVSIPKEPVDRGIYNPNNVPENNLVTLYIHGYVNVAEMDNNRVSWWIEGRNNHQQQIVKIQEGVHSFSVSYHDGNRYTLFPLTVIGQFNKGNSYLLKGIITGQRVIMRIVQYNDGKEGEEVTLDLERLRGEAPDMMSTYIKYVMNPTMDNVENTVKLENDECILMFEPDMIYSIMNKETGQTTTGRCGFNMDLRMTEGKLFLFETDISQMSREDFLKSKYIENAQIIMIPIRCSEKEVTFKYEKPGNLKGKEITFFIEEIKK